MNHTALSLQPRLPPIPKLQLYRFVGGGRLNLPLLETEYLSLDHEVDVDRLLDQRVHHRAGRFLAVKQPGSGRNRNRTQVPALSSRTRWIRTRGSSAFLENPLDPNPWFLPFFRVMEPVELQAASS